MSHDERHHPPAAPLDLIDEYWFFSNTLNGGKNKNGEKKKPPLLPKSPSTTTKPHSTGQGLGCRRLLRTPSLPAPRMTPNKEDQADKEVEDDDLNWSSIYEGVLRTRIASSQGNSSRSSWALERAPSMPVVPSSESDKEKEMLPGNNKLRHSYSTLERHTNSKQQTPRSSACREVRSKQPAMMMVRSKSTVFHLAADKKNWKSSSDLESMEVQGFKDLGFVFDKEELREDLADVLPGLNKKNATGHGAVRRPYLSEAWHHDRRRSAPPALIREARSAAEMKDQLRMWAQAVACNVRQDCV